MVLINCKRLPKEEYSKDYDEFLVTFPLNCNIGEATDIVQKIQNLRLRLKWMVAAAKQLAKDSCTEETRRVLENPALEGERYLDLGRTIEAKMECKLEDIERIISLLKGAAMIAFPQDCSGPDALQRLTAKLESESSSDPDRAFAHRLLSLLDDGATTEDTLVGSAALWWCGKQLDKSKDFSKYVGKNDKTKLVVKLTKEGSNPPPREPPVDARTQTEMMAFWYKKQEEAKKLVEDDDISFGNSEWANPKNLKQQLLGFEGKLKFKGM